MRVDFYHLTTSIAEQALAQVAEKALAAGQRMLVVAEGQERLTSLSEALWARDGFLANGIAGGAHDARQPVLLSETLDAPNGAAVLALADGTWRETDAFERVLYLFDGSVIEDARALWRSLRKRDGIERHYWQQEGGRWVESR